MKLKLECPFAKYDASMKIRCAKTESLCANQRWLPCKGWSALTEWAANCPAREVKEEAPKRGRKRKQS